MGIIDTISSVLSSWRNKKRKRADDEIDNGDENSNKKICTYTLTPQEKFVNNIVFQRTCQHVYLYDEEVKTTETRNYEFKTGGVLFGNDNLNRVSYLESSGVRTQRQAKLHYLTSHIDNIMLIRKYASAFLNSEGGVLLAGVTDKGVVKGVIVNQRDEDIICKTTKDEIERFRPRVSEAFWGIKFVPVSFKNSRKPIFNGDNRYVVEFTFKKGNDEDIYENGNHEVYLRRDGGVQGPLRPLDLKNFVISRYNETLSKRMKKSRGEEKLKVLSQEETKRERLETNKIAYIVID